MLIPEFADEQSQAIVKDAVCQGKHLTAVTKSVPDNMDTGDPLFQPLISPHIRVSMIFAA